MTPTAFFQILHDSQIGTDLRESLYMYPLVEGAHLLSLALSFGLILFTDLRLIGVFFREIPVGLVLKQLRPWMIGGFVITFVTGFLLVAADGPRLLSIPVFPLKLLLVVLAGVNALWFELKFGRHLSQLAAPTQVPTGAKMVGWVSLFSWSAVVVCGRLIPYLDAAH